MKNGILALSVLVLFWSCKKEEPDAPATITPSVQTGDINLKLEFYDSLGQKTNAVAGQSVRLDAVNSGTIDANGEVVFKDIAQGNYYLSVVRDFFESTPLKIEHKSAVTTATVPFAAIAPWQAKNFTSVAYNRDSIVVNFKLDRPIPIGKQVKMALITGADNTLSGSNYKALDIFFTGSDNVNQLNIAKFAAFKNYITALDSGTVYYIKVLPVSYGEYTSNVLGKKILLGDNLFPPDNWLIKKEWKDL